MQGNRHRREVLKVLLATAATAAMPRPSFSQAAPRLVVVGGGFAGATCARELKRSLPHASVVLVEAETAFMACPFSNGVVAGLRDMGGQRFGYDGVRKAGVELVVERGTAVDPRSRLVTLAGGATIPYDRLVLGPGIDIRFDGVPGYSQSAAEAMPHAWKAGEQTLLLRRQLEAMDDGGTVVMSVPANPYRCPPGPYERASLIAYYLKERKPRAKLIVLDAKDTFSKQRLFQAAWKELYPNLEWIGLSSGGKVTAVDPATKTFTTEFGDHRADVGNVIPPQRAGAIAQAASVADRTGWCPIDPETFESKLQPNIHVIGDACIAGAMPKSAFSANAQAKVCAAAVASLLKGEKPAEAKLINTCYSLVAPDYGISVAGVYRPANGLLADIDGAGGLSPLDAPRSFRALEAQYAESWFVTTTAEVFG